MRIHRSVLFRIGTVSRRAMILAGSSVLVLATLVTTALILQRPQTTHAATPPDTCFNFNLGTGTITDYYDNEANNPANPACPRAVDIPSTIGGVTVTTIGDGAFYQKQLTAVTIPDTVTSLGSGAFFTNQLTTVAIPSSVASIGYSAFYHNQLTTLTLPFGVTSIQNGAFSNNQLSSLLIPDSVIEIQTGAFSNNQLTSVTIPHSVTSLGYAFVNNPITSMTIAAQVAIPNGFFGGQELQSLTLEEGVTSIGAGAFPGNQLTSLIIPDSVTSIGDGAFSGNKLTSVTLSDSVTVIGAGAFYGNLLTSVTIPNSVTSIGGSAFASNSLNAVTIQGNPAIGSNAFALSGLDRSTIPSNISPYTQQYYEYYQNNAELIPIHATDPDFIAANTDAFSIDCTGLWNGTSYDPPCYVTSGYLINPASVDIRYVNSADSELSVTRLLVSSTPGSIPDYRLFHILDTTDPDNPTLNFAAGNYYRIGDTVTLTEDDIPSIDGYITPMPTQPLILNAPANSHDFIYYTQAELDAMNDTEDSKETNGSGVLAETGTNLWLMVSGGMALLGIGAGIVVKRLLRA